MPSMKAVLQLSEYNQRIRTKAFVTVSKFQGIKLIAVDDRTGKLTVAGEIDVPVVVMKLRKKGCRTEVVSVGVENPPENNNPVQPRPENGASSSPVNHQYGYNPAYPNSYYQSPYEPDSCVIM